jgi:hypothetical protein
MRPDPLGFWVRYEDVIKECDLIQARSETAAKVEALQAIHKTAQNAAADSADAAYERGVRDGRREAKEQHKADLAAEFEKGFQAHKTQCAEASMRFELSGATHYNIEHKDTRALINELYHDRARLERVVKGAAELLHAICECVVIGEWIDSEDAPVEDMPIIGSAVQFVDTHGGE